MFLTTNILLEILFMCISIRLIHVLTSNYLTYQINSLPVGLFLMHLFLPTGFFFKLTLNNSLRNTIRLSNSLDLNQDQCYANPHLGPRWWQRLLANGKLAVSNDKVNQ